MPSLQNYLMGLGGLLSISYQLQARSVHVLSMCCTFLFVQATKPCSALHPQTQLSPKISCTAHGWVHFGLPSPQPHLPPQCASSHPAQPKIPSLPPALHHHNLPGSQLHCPFTRALHACVSVPPVPQKAKEKKKKEEKMVGGQSPFQMGFTDVTNCPHPSCLQQKLEETWQSAGITYKLQPVEWEPSQTRRLPPPRETVVPTLICLTWVTPGSGGHPSGQPALPCSVLVF